MKLRGQSQAQKASGKVHLPRAGGADIVISVKAMPLGIEEDMNKLFPEPAPPQAPVAGKRGMPLRDPDTKKVVYGPDLNDPKYLQDRQDRARRTTVFLLLAGLDDPELKFDTTIDLSNVDAAAATCDAVHKELKEFGLSTGDLILIVDSINQCSNLSGDEVDRAKEAFSSRELPASPG
jgi:hypothetical protein